MAGGERHIFELIVPSRFSIFNLYPCAAQCLRLFLIVLERLGTLEMERVIVPCFALRVYELWPFLRVLCQAQTFWKKIRWTSLEFGT